MNKLIGCVVLVIGLSQVGCEQMAEQGGAGPGEPTSVAVPSGQQARVYVVAEGDEGFTEIAEKVYGDPKYWRLIAEANPGVDPRMLKPGDELFIPPPPAGGE